MADSDSDDGPQRLWERLDSAPFFPRDLIEESSATDQMKCAVTLQVMEDPACVGPCGHTFDYSSLAPLLDPAHRRCPKCRGKIDHVVRLPDMRQMIRETVRTWCPIKGCEVVMTVDGLDSHIIHQCQHARCVKAYV